MAQTVVETISKATMEATNGGGTTQNKEDKGRRQSAVAYGHMKQEGFLIFK